MTLIVSRGMVTGWWARLVAGDVGLAKTFWLFYFGAALIWNLAIEVISRSGLVHAPAAFAVLQIVVAAYIIPVTVGVWRAADKYKGNLACAKCAKATSVLGVVALASVIYLLISMGTSW